MLAPKKIALALTLSVGFIVGPQSPAFAGDPIQPDSSNVAPKASAQPPTNSTPPAAQAASSNAATSAPPPASPPREGEASPKNAEPQGVLVICVSDESAPACRSLAREVYGVSALRPHIDDPTARVLAGETPKPDASAKLLEIAEVRKAAAASPGDAITRRLFTSLGTDLGAALVVPVAILDGRPTARILSVSKGAFEPIVLSGSMEADPASPSAPKVVWNGVAAILVTLLPKSSGAEASTNVGKGGAGATSGAGVGSGAPAPAKGPLATKADEPVRSFWSSPWTWVGIGAVVAAGVAVFAVSQTQGDAGSLRLQGRVSP